MKVVAHRRLIIHFNISEAVRLFIIALVAVQITKSSSPTKTLSNQNGRYIHQKSLATLQPVEKRGTGIYWNGHNIANTACIYFKFGTIDIRCMLNWIPMQIGKI